MLLVDAQDRRVVLIELRLDRGASPPTVRRRFNRLFKDVFGTTGPPQPVPVARHYVRCVLTPDEITELVRGGDADGQRGLGLIYRVWPDLVLSAHLDRSVSTIKGDAAIRTFGSAGAGIVWAVLDSGIDATHPHFATHDTLTASAVAKLHRDFTIPSSPLAPQGKPYGFKTGCFYRLDANAVICAIQSPFSGAHSDIQHPEVIWAVVDAAGLGA